MTVRKMLFVLIVAALAAAPAEAAKNDRMGQGSAPKLMAPGDLADLGGKDKLEFRWDTASEGAFDYYDFRLYKGTQTYESGLILKEKVSPREHSFLVDAKTFTPGETYCWSLRRVGASKSRSNYSIFKIKS